MLVKLALSLLDWCYLDTDVKEQITHINDNTPFFMMPFSLYNNPIQLEKWTSFWIVHEEELFRGCHKLCLIVALLVWITQTSNCKPNLIWMELICGPFWSWERDTPIDTTVIQLKLYLVHQLCHKKWIGLDIYHRIRAKLKQNRKEATTFQQSMVSDDFLVFNSLKNTLLH